MDSAVVESFHRRVISMLNKGTKAGEYAAFKMVRQYGLWLHGIISTVFQKKRWYEEMADILCYPFTASRLFNQIHICRTSIILILQKIMPHYKTCRIYSHNCHF
jgi:hypothetical protein